MFIFSMKVGEKRITFDENLVFQKLSELVLIRGTSEAICSNLWINWQHDSRNLGPENYSNEMVLRVNLGPFAVVSYEPQLIQIVLKTEKRLINFAAKI